MKTIGERFDEMAETAGVSKIDKAYYFGRSCCFQIATEQKAIDKELIDMLIEELYTSRAYHLGITGLDSAAEIARKERDGNCALIRRIDSTIKYVRESMEE